MAKAVPQEATQSAAKQFQCGKCGHHEASTQIRVIRMTVGWNHCQFMVVAPARMCTKCGEKEVTFNFEVGDLAGVVPEAGGLANIKSASGQSVDQIDAAIGDLQEMRERVEMQDVQAEQVAALDALPNRRTRRVTKATKKKASKRKKKVTKRKARK